MTLDETPRGPGDGGEGRRVGAPRSTTRDLERYAGLFAARTQGMKSSAMRDLMAVTAQPEIISLAGGLPDTTTFPAEDFAALMAHVAADSAAAALQYGPTEGLDDVKDCIVQVMAAEGMAVELEDNPYGLLRYEGEPQPTLYALDGGEYVIYLGTFSKILSPGLRLGWTAAPRPVLEKLNLGKGATDLCSAPLSQHFVSAYFAERDWRR